MPPFRLRLHSEKRAIRALGVAESFRKDSGRYSVLAGVVMRSDLIIDGVVFGRATLEGDDATTAIIQMYEGLARRDINLIVLGGAVISLYNIIDIDAIGQACELPVICLTFEESSGLEAVLKRHFPDRWRSKLAAYRRLGTRETVRLRTGYSVYVRAYGVELADARRVLNKYTLQGAVPEPIRVAKIIAKAEFDAHSRDEAA